MKLFYIIPLVLLFALSHDAQAQDYIKIYGVINDADSLIPLPGASVYSMDLGIGTTSNLEGEYELQIPKRDVEIRFTYLGYNTEFINLKQSEIASSDSLEFNISLKQNMQELPWTYIEAEYRTAIFEENTEAPLDFEFYDEYILLLLSGKGWFRILVLDNKLKELSTFVLQEKPKSFFKDCFGGIHLIYQKRIDELSIQDGSVEIRKSHPIAAFHQYLEPCIASSRNCLYFRKFESSSLSTSYFSRNRSTGDSLLICTLVDEVNLKSVKEFRDELQRSIDEMNHSMHDQSRRYVELRRSVQQYKWFERMILSQSEYNPLFIAYDKSYVFDHLKGHIMTFDEQGNILGEVPCNYHLQDSWNQKIHQDHANGSFYVELEDKGVFTLLHLDVNSGKTKYALRIADHAYPEGLKVRNGQAWYIHQGVDQRAPALYRMDLIQ